MDNSHLTWRKSTYSGGNGGECIEVASVGGPLVAVRDSKNLDGPELTFTLDRWQEFTCLVRKGPSYTRERLLAPFRPGLMRFLLDPFISLR